MNISLWDPHFALPMVGYTICDVEKGIFMEDHYIGDMLFNFMLSQEEIPFCGVDLNIHKYKEWEKDISGGWEIWERKMMGLTDLPYNE